METEAYTQSGPRAVRLSRERRAALETRVTEHIVDLIRWDLEAGTDPLIELADEYGEEIVRRAFEARMQRMEARRG